VYRNYKPSIEATLGEYYTTSFASTTPHLYTRTADACIKHCWMQKVTQMFPKDRERHVDERDANDVETRFVC
jgi:hypothetical protein